MMHRGLSVLLLVAAPVAAGAAPQAVVPPLHAGKDITEAARAGFDDRLRKALAGKVEVLAPDATKQALSKAGAEKGCEDAACAEKLAKASGARFVVLANVQNEEEIYKVTVAVFDAAQDKITSTQNKSCELCAVNEVNGTIDGVVAALVPALSAPEPAKEPPPPPPKVDKRVQLQVRSEPSGAKVVLDGLPAGETPLTTQVDTGGHTLTLDKDGYQSEMRAVTVQEGGLEVDVPLKVVAEPSAALAQATEPAHTPSYRPWGWGLTLGGVLAAGAGSYLIVLDGKVTCKDGRGRADCPNVYNTKVPGMAVMGGGAAALGIGLTMLILDPGGVPSAGAATVQPTAGGALLDWSGVY
jgi:hypothetical protein